jgi:hypothetical protein
MVKNLIEKIFFKCCTIIARHFQIAKKYSPKTSWENFEKERIKKN